MPHTVYLDFFFWLLVTQISLYRLVGAPETPKLWLRHGQKSPEILIYAYMCFLWHFTGSCDTGNVYMHLFLLFILLLGLRLLTLTRFTVNALDNLLVPLCQSVEMITVRGRNLDVLGLHDMLSVSSNTQRKEADGVRANWLTCNQVNVDLPCRTVVRGLPIHFHFSLLPLAFLSTPEPFWSFEDCLEFPESLETVRSSQTPPYPFWTHLTPLWGTPLYSPISCLPVYVFCCIPSKVSLEHSLWIPPC